MYRPTRWHRCCRFRRGDHPISCVRSDNRRVLLPHTDAHQHLMDAGGDHRVLSYGDGAYRLRGNAFGKQTQGRIPKNVIQRGHRCADTMGIRKVAKELGLSPHPAMFPTDIPELAIRFLTEAGELVVDPFCGFNKSGLAAERNDRRWTACDNILDVHQAAGRDVHRFRWILDEPCDCNGGSKSRFSAKDSLFDEPRDSNTVLSPILHESCRW